ncbi:hypothetical protein M885DRAFT_269388 [Pelagophyceae sp. CCMP2097]|nr:hypothetical protein M885DRAFT_269388 [Pelagophyceae sp. CCMP2097]
MLCPNWPAIPCLQSRLLKLRGLRRFFFARWSPRRQLIRLEGAARAHALKKVIFGDFCCANSTVSRHHASDSRVSVATSRVSVAHASSRDVAPFRAALPHHAMDAPPAAAVLKPCCVCAEPGGKHCTKCKSRHYCGKACQLVRARAKAQCKQPNSRTASSTRSCRRS